MHTIHGEVAQRGAGSSLHFDIGAFEEVEDRLEGALVHGSDICQVSMACPYSPSPGDTTSFGDLGKGQAGAALQVDVLRIDKSAQGVEGLASEEVGLGSLCAVR